MPSSAPRFSCLVLLAPLLVACSREITLEYRLDLRDAQSGTVAVELEITGLPAEELVLHGLLADRLLGLDALEARGRGGRQLEVERLPSEGSASARLASWRIDARAAGSRALIRWTCRPGTYLPPNGIRELRHLGYAGPEGCALALPNVVLVPALAADRVRFSLALPPGWRAVAAPSRFDRPDADAWWQSALIAGPYAPEPEQIGSLEVVLPAGADAELFEGVSRLERELKRWLGPPRRVQRLVGLPRAADLQQVELPGTLPFVACDFTRADPGAWRDLVRQLVPAWLGRTPLEVELDESPDAWFLLGLAEYLAWKLPCDAGLVARDPDRGLEHTWTREETLPGVALAEPTDRVARTQILRRLAAGVRMHDLAQRLEPHGGLAELVRDFSGEGLPRLDPRDPRAELVSLCARPLPPGERGRLPFEEAWRLELAAHPLDERPDSPVARVVGIAFTSDTSGYLESCGCKLSQEGGIARRASALEALRAEDPSLLVVDLGNFAPIDSAKPRLHPSVHAELGIYVELMARVGYDAASIGQDELYSGAEELRAEVERLPLRLVGCGVGVAERRPYPCWVRIERPGFSLAYVAYSELLEQGSLREAQEAQMKDVIFPTSPDEVLALVTELRGTVDLVVVGGHMSPQSARALAAPGRGVDVLLLGRLERTPAFGFLGDTAVAMDTVGSSGIDHLRLYLDKAGKVFAGEVRTVRLPRSHASDPGVQAELDAFYQSLAGRPELAAEMRPLFAWDDWHADDYVGAASCEECHPDPSSSWRASAHATALQTLVGARRDHHPKCVQCHVLGLGTQSGYELAAPDPGLAGVQCEACHGAGGAHVRAPSRQNIRRTPPRKTCLECHDQEHSEDFEARFEQSWELVRH